MKFWNELEGSKFFSMVFSEEIIIDQIRLYSLIVDNEQPTITLAFDIKELPDRPPRKWEANSYNACRLGITGSEVENLIVRQLPTREPLRLTIKRTGTSFFISAISTHSLIEFTASFVYLENPTVYLTRKPFV